ncbi:MAG: hypothetical protein WB902_18980, partial [Acetobacteraceae bacterium]
MFEVARGMSRFTISRTFASDARSGAVAGRRQRCFGGNHRAIAYCGALGVVLTSDAPPESCEEYAAYGMAIVLIS